MPTQFYAIDKNAVGFIKKETTAGTPVIPTTPFYYQSQSLATNFENETVDVAAGSRSEHHDVVPGKNAAPAGQIVMPVQADTIGHFLTGSLGAPSTSGPTDSVYTHDWTSNDQGTIPTYTVEVGNSDAGYAFRYCGARFGVEFMNRSNVLFSTASMMARYAFINARLDGALLAGAETAELDTNHGLAVGDTFVLGFLTANQETVTLTSVDANGTTIGFAATSNTHADGDLCVIAPRTPSYSTATRHFAWIGGATVSLGTAIGSVTEVAKLDDFTLNYNQKLEPETVAGGVGDFARYPIDVLVATNAATASFGFVHKDITFIDYMRRRQSVAVDITYQGNLVGATSYDEVRFRVPELVLDPSMPSGSPILREQHSGKAKVSASAGYDVKITVKNAVVSY